MHLLGLQQLANGTMPKTCYFCIYLIPLTCSKLCL